MSFLPSQHCVSGCAVRCVIVEHLGQGRRAGPESHDMAHAEGDDPPAPP
ncbi:hypothetical protein [Streptomyces sp. SAS_276]